MQKVGFVKFGIVLVTSIKTKSTSYDEKSIPLVQVSLPDRDVVSVIQFQNTGTGS